MEENMELTLLSLSDIYVEVEGTDLLNEPLDIIAQHGSMSVATDLAVITGACVDFEQGRYSDYCFKDTDTDYDIYVLDSNDDVRIGGCNERMSIRPVLINPDFDYASFSTSSDMFAIYGEYPQNAAPLSLQKELETAYSNNTLNKTGNSYTFDAVDCSRCTPFCPVTCDEYEYENKKYIRAKVNIIYDNICLSNGQIYNDGDYVWIQVEPVKWLVDYKTKKLVSLNVLLSGIRFSNESNYNSDFKKTEMYGFLNEYMLSELMGKSQVEKKNKKPSKKINPYNLNLNKVSEEDIIKGAIESGVAVFLHGPSSEGKSARVKQIDPTCEIIYLRNASPESLNGKSVYNQETGEMIDVKPTWLRKVEAKCESEPDKLHIVFFDEITNALPSIQGIAFNIVLDREVNGIWKLPENARIVASGNEMEDSLAANQLAEPLFNRFAHVYIKTTTESWLKWASEHNIHPAIYTYIAYKKGKTLRSKFNGEKPNADPRKWEMASKMLYTTGNPEMLRSLVGEDITREFTQFCNQQVITLEDVINDNYTAEDIQKLNTAERYATAMTLSQVDEDNLEKVRTFATKLGGECRAIFDSLWTHGDDERLEKIAELGQDIVTNQTIEKIDDIASDDVELTLLSLDEVQGNTKLNVLEKYGSCSIMCNDLTTVTGAASDYYYTKTADAEGDIYIVDECGNLGIAEAGDYNGLIRPVLVSPTIFSEVYNNGYAIDDTHYVHYGEYPQFAASTRLQKELNDAEITGKLIPTGRKYTFYQQHGTQLITHPEYEYENKRYIKVNVCIYGDVGAMLSDGEIYETGDDVWLSVDTITWLVDEENKRLISEYGLLSGVKFHRLIKSSFEKSSVYRFLNDHMLKDMLQSYEEEKVKRKLKK